MPYRRTLCLVLLLAMNSMLGADELEAEYARRRADMVEEVAAMAEEVAQSSHGRPISSTVLQAMARVPRHRFVPEEWRRYAYHNRPLSIGHGQTISQPYIVALMTDLLALPAGARVLEVGTGSGYQAAMLAELGFEVYSIEIVAPLAQQAEQALREAGYAHVRLRHGDGYQGWPEQAPFDGIVVTAGATHVPQPLLDQLRTGGRMVIPLGAAFEVQELMLIEARPDGARRSQIIPVRFVPLTGGPATR